MRRPSRPTGLVQIVNFGERFPDVIDSGLAEATLRVYAGGMKSKTDIVELLKRNPDAARDDIRTLCRRYRLRGLEPLIREADAASERH